MEEINNFHEHRTKRQKLSLTNANPSSISSYPWLSFIPSYILKEKYPKPIPFFAQKPFFDCILKGYALWETSYSKLDKWVKTIIEHKNIFLRKSLYLYLDTRCHMKILCYNDKKLTIDILINDNTKSYITLFEVFLRHYHNYFNLTEDKVAVDKLVYKKKDISIHYAFYRLENCGSKFKELLNTFYKLFPELSVYDQYLESGCHKSIKQYNYLCKKLKASQFNLSDHIDFLRFNS